MPLSAFSSHLWTVANRLRPRPEAPPAEEWALEVADPTVGKVRLTGLLREEPGSETLLVFLHGIGGCATALYAQELASVAAEMGVSCLRLNLRGCDRLGGDYYHAGLSDDVAYTLACPRLEKYRRVVLLGYSLGGHLALRYAAVGPGGWEKEGPGEEKGRGRDRRDPRLRAVAAVCAPLDLGEACRAIDARGGWAYRRYVLRNLRSIYAAVAARREVPIPVEATRRITRISEWDDAVVAPRWGFESAEDYYRRASVAPHLGKLEVPALLVAARSDPMVPARVLEPVLERFPDAPLETHWIDRGGHVAFPADLDLGVEGAPLGLPGQALGWLLNRAEAG